MKYYQYDKPTEDHLLVCDETILEAERLTLYYVAQEHVFWSTDYNEHEDIEKDIPYYSEYKRVCKYFSKHKKPMEHRGMCMNIFKEGGSTVRDNALKAWENNNLGYSEKVGRQMVFYPTGPVGL